MGIRLFGSSSSYDNKSKSNYPSGPIGFHLSKNETKVGKVDFHPYNDIDQIKARLIDLEKANDKQPRADKFQIKLYYEVSGNLILVLVYPNCSNYEGQKILVYKGITLEELLKKNNNLIDPHFSDNPNFVSPVARFVPTKEGIDFAFQFAKNML